MFKFPGKGPAHLSVSMTHNSRHFYQGLSAKILTRTSLQEETDKPSFVKWFTKKLKKLCSLFQIKDTFIRSRGACESKTYFNNIGHKLSITLRITECEIT